MLQALKTHPSDGGRDTGIPPPTTSAPFRPGRIAFFRFAESRKPPNMITANASRIPLVRYSKLRK